MTAREVMIMLAKAFLGAIALVIVTMMLAILAGCDTLQRRPVAIQTHTVDAPRVVTAPCVTPEEIPPETPTSMPEKSADRVRKAAGAYVDMRTLKQENDALRALLKQCTKLEGQP